MVENIKAKALTWYPLEADENPFETYTIEQFKGLLGAIAA